MYSLHHKEDKARGVCVFPSSQHYINIKAVGHQSGVRRDQGGGEARRCSGCLTRQQTATPAAPPAPDALPTWQLFPLATGAKTTEPGETALQSVRVQPEGQDTSTWSLSADIFSNRWHSRDGAWQQTAWDVAPLLTTQRLRSLPFGRESAEIPAADHNVQPVRWCCVATHSGLAWTWHCRPPITQHRATAYTPSPPRALKATHSICPLLSEMVSPAWTPSGV